MSRDFCVSDYYKLRALYSAIMTAKFDRHGAVLVGSPFIAAMIEELSEILEERQPEYRHPLMSRIPQKPYVQEFGSSSGNWQFAVRYVMQAENWPQWSHAQRIEVARTLMCPMKVTDEQLIAFVSEVDQRIELGGALS